MQHFPAYHERKLTDGQHVFIATTGGAKRDGLALDMAGGQFDNYLRNPVFLWAHDYTGRTLPIGKVTRLAPSKTRLKAWVTFDREDEFARQVERKFDEGYLNAVSVGWMDMERDNAGMITKWDLLDISAVPVPGDPDALIERELALVRSFIEEHTPEPPAGKMDPIAFPVTVTHKIEDDEFGDVPPAAVLEREDEPDVHERAAIPATEEETAPDAALPPLTRVQLGELVGERVEALAEAIAAYKQQSEPPTVEEPPVDETAEALRLLNNILKEMQ